MGGGREEYHKDPMTLYEFEMKVLCAKKMPFGTLEEMRFLWYSTRTHNRSRDWHDAHLDRIGRRGV